MTADIWAGLGAEDAAGLRAKARELQLGAGQTVFTEGEVHSSVYVVASGSVEIFVAVEGRPDRVLTVLDPGEIFGEVGMLLEKPRTATARATADATVLEITRSDFLSSLHAGERWAKRFLLHAAEILAERMGAVDEALVELIGRLPGEQTDELERLRSHLFTKWSF